MIAQRKGFDVLITTEKNRTCLDGPFLEKMRLDQQMGPTKIGPFLPFFQIFSKLGPQTEPVSFALDSVNHRSM